MKPTPPGWPRLSTSLYYQDAARMLDWLCEAFGFELRLKVEGDAGRIEHSEITYGDAVMMIGSERDRSRWGVNMLSPKTANANTQGLMIYVDDADAHCAQARRAGAQIIDEPSDHDYGADYWCDRSYGALDPEGHMWWFSQRLRNAPA